MSVWTSTVALNPPKLDLPSSSASTTVESAPSSARTVAARIANAEQTEFAHLPQNVTRNEALFLPATPVRPDLIVDKTRDLLPEGAMLIGEIDAIHGLTSLSSTRCPARSA